MPNSPYARQRNYHQLVDRLAQTQKDLGDLRRIRARLPRHHRPSLTTVMRSLHSRCVELQERASRAWEPGWRRPGPAL